VIIARRPAGNAAALAAVDAGARSVLVVEGDAFGRTCTNRGAFPRNSARQERADGEERRFRDILGKTPGSQDALTKGLSRSIEKTLVEKGVETFEVSENSQGRTR